MEATADQGCSPPFHGTRVLLVDGSPSRHLLAGLLRMDGVDVIDTDCGRSAVEALRVQEFDIVLSDLELTDIPGDVLVGYIRGVTGGRTRVAAMTGEGEPGPSRARAAGAEAVLVKPVAWEAVIDFVRGGVGAVGATSPPPAPALAVVAAS